MNGTYEGRPAGFTTVEMLLEDVSKQMAAANNGRFSRSIQGQRTGGSMRVVKPNSASNSPRGSVGLGRRRTVMNDGAYRRRIALLEQQNAMAMGNFVSNDTPQVPVPSARPMSWHPASSLASQHTYQPDFARHSSVYHHQQHRYDLPPTPAAYSDYTSPESTFSPLSMPYTGYEKSQYSYQNPTTSQSHLHYAPIQQPLDSQHTEQAPLNTDSNMYTHLDWNNFAVNGFGGTSTMPPTPESFLPIQHPEPAFPAEASIPYRPLEDCESGGEELIGMGLYDSPDPIKSTSTDPQLDNYRALMMSHMLSTGHLTMQSTGKGLKLEETWEPPASDDDTEDCDGDEEEEEEEIAQTLPARPQALADIQSYAQGGWL